MTTFPLVTLSGLKQKWSAPLHSQNISETEQTFIVKRPRVTNCIHDLKSASSFSACLDTELTQMSQFELVN